MSRFAPMAGSGTAPGAEGGIVGALARMLACLATHYRTDRPSFPRR